MTSHVVRLEPSAGPSLPAGRFSRWLEGMAGALAAGGESDVPCGDCSACCQGAYFIHVQPTDAGALTRIPAALLFDAPGAGAGHRLMGYDTRGRCPMLREGACTIYEDRPRTCRTYDCRIFAATGLAEPGEEKSAIMARAARWRFQYADAAERDRHEALKAAAWAVVSGPASLEDVLPRNATQIAMLLVRHHAALLAPTFALDGAGVDRLRKLFGGD